LYKTTHDITVCVSTIKFGKLTINNAIGHIGLLTRSLKISCRLLFLTFRMYTSDVENVTRADGQGKLAMSKSATCKYI